MTGDTAAAEPTGTPTAAQWLAGARPRTLPAAVSPVLAGTGVAAYVGGFDPVTALLALVVSLALQVGVNYANDYSDGIRGTLTTSRTAPPPRSGWSARAWCARKPSGPPPCSPSASPHWPGWRS